MEVRRSAVLSPDGVYRYTLSRVWDESRPSLAVLMFNPSTADGETDDPTIRRLINFACGWGFGRIRVVNLFAFRATNPRDLYHVSDPDGPENARAVEKVVHASDLALAAFGANAAWNGTHRQYRGWRRWEKYHGLTDWFVLGVTRSGIPLHPLYVPRDVPLRPYTGEVRL